MLRTTWTVLVTAGSLGAIALLGGASRASEDQPGKPTPKLASTAAPGETADAPLDFGRDVLPILSNHCYQCHGPDEEHRAADLQLNEREPALAAGAIVPGDPDASPIIERINATHAGIVMPPPGANRDLTPEKIAVLERWVREGAEYGNHWSFVPPTRPDVPTPEHDSWTSPVDRFLLVNLRANGFEPSPRADKARLIRRVTLDLTGLPPTPEEVAAFVADESPNAYEQLVDRLLASPRFGEAWATWWLDKARYADSQGYEKDRLRTMWPYRDWVIHALNSDMPFDQFTREQIAGDMLPNPTDDQVLASAFHRNTQTNTEGGTDDEEYRTAAVIDRVNTTMTVWMGLTVACAQCHTHKYDPILHTEFFGLYAYFNQTADNDEFNDAPRRPFTNDAIEADLVTARAAVTEADARVESTRADTQERREQWVAALRTEDPPAPPADGLLLHESFDGDLAWHGDAPTEPTPGPLGNAAAFADGRFLQPNDDPAFAGFDRDTPYSVSLWLRYEPTGGAGLLGNTDAPPVYRGWDLYAYDRRLAAHLIHDWSAGNATAVQSVEPVFEDGQWHHVVATYDGSSTAAGLLLYVDGRPVPTGAVRDGLTATTQNDKPFRFGQRHNRQPMTGALDDARLYNRALSPDEVRALTHAGHAAIARRDDAPAELSDVLTRAFNATDKPLAAALADADAARARVAELEASRPSVPIMLELTGDQRRQTHLFTGGSFLSPDLDQPIQPHTPAFLHDFGDRAPDRLGLADWLMAPDNPLTARVQVNRVWAQLMGTGIVQTSEDFGLQGAYPTHPELLDWLAIHYQDDLDWSFKSLVRELVTTQAYQQTSRVSPDRLEADPKNAWMTRGPRARLRAEVVRDQALAVSGLLVEELGGPPVVPHLPPGQLPQAFDGYVMRASTGDDLHRRGLYTLTRRTGPYDSFITFDAPSREFCIVQRDQSNTPLQALVTLNDPVYLEAAQALARTLLTDADDLPARLDRLFHITLARGISDAERDILTGVYEEARSVYLADTDAAQRFATQPIGPLPDGVDPVEAASLTTVCNVVLNLDELLTKN